MRGVAGLITIGIADTGDKGPIGTRLFMFGCAGNTTVTSARYYWPHSTAANVVATPVEEQNDVAGTLRNLVVRIGTNTADTDTTFVVYVNGAATTLTVVVPAGSTTTVTDFTNTVAVAAGDKISLRSTRPAGTAGIGLLNTYGVFEREAS